MKHLTPHSLIRRGFYIAGSILFTTREAFAQVYGGPGLQGGIDKAKEITGPIQDQTARQIILRVLKNALNLVALAAAIAIIVAGIYLIVGGASDEMRGKAKKIIIWSLIGLAVVLLAKALVQYTIVTITTQL